jgi:endonuclease/exonuclease/phosphatase family metal-dependent hydrolase
MCLINSCAKRTAETVFLNVSAKNLVFWPEASVKTLQISGNCEFSAQLSDPVHAAWCKLNLNTGNTDNLSVTVTANQQIGMERAAQIVVSAKESNDLKQYIDVKQMAVEAKVSVRETQVTVNESEGLLFELTVTSNIPVTFDFPAWIALQGENPAATGTQKYTFAVTPLTNEETREGSLSVRSADPSVPANSVAIAVRQTKAVCELRVATYNIYVGHAADDTGWGARKAMVSQLVRTHDFDIFGVQEAQKDQIDDILAAGGYSYTGTGRDGGTSGEHSAVIYKTGKFDLLERGDFWYSETPDVPGLGWDATCCNRICSWGKFRERTTGRTFYFFNSHYDHQGVTARYESAKLMVAKIKAIAGSYPVFATGDYNANTTGNSIRYILTDGLLKDSRALSETTPSGTAGTFNGFSYTLNQMTENLRIDFIFLSDRIHVKEYRTLNDRPNGKYPSDHDPVFIHAKF